MDITPLTSKDTQIINRYGDGGFVINEATYKGAVLILENKTLQWPVIDLDNVSFASFKPVFDINPLPEILIVGTGKRSVDNILQLFALLKGKGVAIDIMDTGAACRTYNVLLTEGRRVVAAMLPV